MYIDRIKVNNFSILKDKELDFSNVNLIYGSNGSGKSTLVSLIEYVLRDSIDRKLETLPTYGTNDFKIESVINYNEHILHFSNRLTNKSTKKQLKINNEVYDNSEAINKLQSLVNPKITKFSFIKQGDDKDRIINATPTERLVSLKTIFGLEDLQKIVNMKKDKIQKMETELVSINSKLSILTNNKYDLLEIPNMNHDIKEIESKIELYKSIVDAINTYKNDLSKYLLEKSKYDFNVSKRSEIQSNINELEKSLKTINEKYEVFKNTYPDLNLKNIIIAREHSIQESNSKVIEYKTIVNKYMSTKQEYENLNKTILEKDYDKYSNKPEIEKQEIVKLINECQNDIKVLNRNIDTIYNLNSNLNNLKYELRELDFEEKQFPIENLDDLKLELEKDIQSISNIIFSYKQELDLIKEGKCSKCKRPFDSHEDDIKALNENISKSESVLESKQLEKSNIEKLIKEKANYLLDKKAYMTLESKISDCNNEINTYASMDYINNQLNERLSNLKSLESKLDYCNMYESSKIILDRRNELKSILFSIDIDRVNTTISDIEYNIELSRKEIEILNVDYISIQKLDNELKYMESNKIKLQSELESLEILEKPIEPIKPKNLDESNYNELTKWQNEKLLYEQSLKEIKRIQDHNEKVIAQKELNDKEIETLQNSYKSISNKQRIESEGKKILDKDFPSYVIQSNVKELEWRLNEKFGRIYNKDYTFKFEISEKGDSVDLLYSSHIEKAKDENIKVLSMGEKQILETLIRIILVSMNGLKFIVLDECDSFLKDEFSKKLFEVLIEDDFEQIFVISHKVLTQTILINDFNANVIEL